MELAPVLLMSTERNWDDRPFDDVREIKKQLDKLTGSIGDMREDVSDLVTALKGNDFGTEGLVARMERIELEQTKMASKLESLERSQRANRRYLNWAFTAAGAAIVQAVRMIIDHLVPIKK